MTATTTLPTLLHRNAASFGNRPAWREKRGGIWQVLTWSDYAAMVSRVASGLAAHGFARGDRLAIIGDNRPRLYAAMLAAQSLGGAAVPLWPDSEPDSIAQVLENAGVSVVVAEDGECLEKLLAIKDRVPALRLVVRTASGGMRQIEYDWLKSFEAVVATGGDATTQSEPGDPALLHYLASPGGELRGTTLSHTELLASAALLVHPAILRESDETLAWLPMAWLGDVLASQALALSVGFTCNCPETPETARRDLREIGPTILVAPPGVWEDALTDVEARAAQASGLKRALFAGFRVIAERAEQHREAAENVPFLLQLKRAVGEALVYAPMRDQIGLRRLRWASTGGEALAPRVLRSFRALGVNLNQSNDMVLAGVIREPAHA